MGDVVITYQTLFELLRKEKDKEELQELSKDFFDDALKYLRSKSDSISSGPGEHTEKNKVQLDNAKKMIKELYNRREKKIMEMAVISSRTGAAAVSTSKLLDQEMKLYKSLLVSLKDSRTSILDALVSQNPMASFSQQSQGANVQQSNAVQQGSSVQGTPIQQHSQVFERQQDSQVHKSGQDAVSIGSEAPQKAENSPETAQQIRSEPDVGVPQSSFEAPKSIKTEPEIAQEPKELKKDENSDINDDNSSDVKTVTFLHSVPKFMGSNLQIFGPFEQDDVVSLPKRIADVLVRKGRAEEVKS